MSQEDNEERPYLHCMIVELIEQFFDEYPASEPDTIDTDEVITAVAKDGSRINFEPERYDPAANDRKADARKLDYDAEFRQEDTVGMTGSAARH